MIVMIGRGPSGLGYDVASALCPVIGVGARLAGVAAWDCPRGQSRGCPTGTRSRVPCSSGELEGRTAVGWPALLEMGLQLQRGPGAWGINCPNKPTEDLKRRKRIQFGRCENGCVQL